MGQSASCKIGVNQKSTLEFEALCCKASNFEISFLASWELKQKVVTFSNEGLLVEFFFNRVLLLCNAELTDLCIPGITVENYSFPSKRKRSKSNSSM